ncbi:tripartite tricarboxylate transporter substrate binding protein [Variovorax sp. PDNC026]|uniref:Bug family tripartite tricarboxylate transporter substrate binding protein n=1 Tax=Variovorax sp. PDNC026 TaxID=2811425 RepID=UPI0019650679|nr:tripartite tricarboxylate transporter substrate binding protein [Variovorax sp. PDNC026]QRY31851.1 tripartite tricarboxylate transporter substrate binding protein [Variovorax sp. PDNC026]
MKSSTRRAFLRSASLHLPALAAAASLAPGLSLAADEFPSRPIRFVSPFTPGGTADILARALGEGMARALNQPVVIENMGGGSGTIGGLAVARARPDGYTLYLGGLGINVVMPMIDKDQPFKPQQQLAPVSLLASYQQIIVARADSPISTLADIVSQSRQKQGLSYGTSGVTTSNYLGTEVLKSEAGFDLIHVPYKGEAPTLQDLMGGVLELANISVSVAMPYIRAGKLKAIVTMYPSRVKELPNVPSVTETYPNVSVDPWFALYTTARTPAATISTLNAAVRKALEEKAIADLLEQRGFVVRSSPSADAFAKFSQAEAATWQARLHKAKLIA